MKRANFPRSPILIKYLIDQFFVSVPLEILMLSRSDICWVLGTYADKKVTAHLDQYSFFKFFLLERVFQIDFMLAFDRENYPEIFHRMGSNVFGLKPLT